MENQSHHTDAARAAARRLLDQFAEEEGADSRIIETVLIRDGQYTGRAFLSAGFRVVWLCGESRLSLFSGDGTLLRESPIDGNGRLLLKAA